MPEQGSDELMRETADWSATLTGVADEEVALAAEEKRVQSVDGEGEEDPGEDYPDPNPPPMAEDHPEYDPTPPAA